MFSNPTLVLKEDNVMAIPNPYPSQYSQKDKISNFVYHNHLQLARLKDRTNYQIPPESDYIVLQNYNISFTLNGNPHEIVVPRGMLTDLASVPCVFRWYVGRVGPHLEATTVHDWLYVAWQGASYLVPRFQPIQKARTDDMRHFADRVMLHAMQASGMRLKADLIYKAIQWGGRGAYFNSNPKPQGLLDADLKTKGL